MAEIVFKSRTNRKLRMDILFEDDNMIVINKPPYLPVIPDRHGTYRNNAQDLLNRHLGFKPFVVHRIDADTSGVVLLAKNELFHQKMNTLFADHKIQKEYLAIVDGCPDPESGCIDLPLEKTGGRHFRMEVHRKGKLSKTDYEVLEKFNHFSLLRLMPQSGRTHQIRVHLQAIGNPLAADPLYGNHSQINLSMIKKRYRYKSGEQPRPLSDRLTLHAHRLGFKDPLDGQEKHFEAPLHKDFKAVLSALKKWASSENQFVLQAEHAETA